MKINKKFKVLMIGTALVLSLGAMVGCTSETTQKVEYKNIDAKKTEKLLEENEGVLVVDVRTSEEYAEGHLVNAINIPFDNFESRINDMESYKDKTVLLYCRTGNRSEKAAKILAENGFKDAQNATEGVEEYEYKLVKYNNITAQEAEKIMNENKEVVVLDVRKANEFADGHLENAINIPLEDVESKISELKDSKDKDVLVYCRVGRRSAEAAEILEKNGFTKAENIVDGVSEYDFKLVK